MWVNNPNYTTPLAAALILCVFVGAKRKIWLIIINMHHKHTRFVFHHRGRPQRIEEMLMCSAAFPFSTGADDYPALSPVGPLPARKWLQQYHHANITRGKSNSSADYPWSLVSSEAQTGGREKTRCLAFQTISQPVVISVAASVCEHIAKCFSHCCNTVSQ